MSHSQPSDHPSLTSEQTPAICQAQAVHTTSGNNALCGKKVLIVQQVLKQYRLAFFQQLAQQLAADGIEFTLCFSLPQGAELAKADNISQPPGSYAKLVPVQTVGPLVWQAIPELASFDLVIVEQANRHLLNYQLLFRRLNHKAPKFIFWGHGFNHQATPGLWSNLKQQFKKTLLGYADGFFAYTQQVANYAIAQGVAADKVTVLNNSIETETFRANVQKLRQQNGSVNAGAADTAVTSTAVTSSAVINSAAATTLLPNEPQPKALPTLIFCGALYPDKQIALLLQTAEQLAKQQLIKKLIVLGDGPDKPLLEAALKAQSSSSQQMAWLDYRGACFGEEKAAAYTEADLVLNPGLVGLAILDAFAAGLPLVTTHFRGHSPEISYLVHGYNGLMVEASQLTQALTQLLQSPQQLQNLAEGAAQSSAQYSLAAMVQAFAGGIRRTLGQP